MTLTFCLLPPDVHELDKFGNDHFWSLSAEDRKAYCRNYVVRLIGNGAVLRQPCCICREPKGEAHHDNYDRPYEVSWLCKGHHIEREREIRRAMPPYNWRVTTLPPLPSERGISRQLRQIAERKTKGLCVKCGARAVTKVHCLPHAIERREQARSRREKKLGRPLLRRNNSLTVRLERIKQAA